MKSYSQTHEQQSLIDIFDKIGFEHRKAVEFGARDGYIMSNIRHFMEEEDFKGYQFDIAPVGKTIKAHITAENINDIFKKHKVPKKFDLLSIDIDGVDYWVWKALKHEPRVVIIEFNPNLVGSKTVEYDPNFKFDRTIYFGASFHALRKLGAAKGYNFVENTRLNMIFVKSELYKPHKEFFDGLFKGYEQCRNWGPDKKNRKWVQV